MALIPVEIAWAPIITKVVYWLGYFLVMALFLGAMVVMYFLMQFRIKAETFVLYGSGQKGQFSFSKPKKNRIKKMRNGSSWRALFPLFNKKDIEPFQQEFIYPGNMVKAFIFNDEWIPARINILGEGEMVGQGKGKPKALDLSAQISPVPHYVRNWQSIKHKEHAQEFAEHNFWEDNKYFFMVLLTASLCLVMVGLTVYFTYNYATGGLNAVSGLTEAIRGFNTAGGIGPH